MGERNYQVIVLALAACLAAFALHAYPVFRPMMVYDDFQILEKSLTWRSTWANLWVPSNEHAMPLGRLSTFALVQSAGRQTLLPLATALQGPLAILAGMGLLYLLVRRELGHSFYGLVALILFGVTSIYHQAVSWFAASFAVLTLDTLLLALLAAQGWRLTGWLRHLALCTLWTALAPAWFAVGVLAGPLCCLYLLPRDDSTPAGWRRRLLSLVPLLGTAVFLAVSLPRTAAQITGLLRDDGRLDLIYGTGQPGWQKSLPLIALNHTGRSLVDQLMLGVCGIGGFACPAVVVLVFLLLLAVGGVWWWRRAPCRRLLVLGLGLILFSYLLIYAGRSHLAYAEDGLYRWTRYALLPYLGLVLFVCGGLPRWQHRFFALGWVAGAESAKPRRTASGPDAYRGVEDSAPATQKSCKRIAHGYLGLLVAGLFVLHLPRALITSFPYDPSQREVLQRIEATDARCRARHLDADTARQALEPLEVPGAGDVNGWVLLRGSDDPHPVSVREAQNLLAP